MAAYRFLGTESHVRDTNPEVKLTRFGQLFELDSQLAEDKIAHEGLLAIPSAEFDKAGFSAEELKKPNSSEQFLAKQKSAWMLLHDYRESLNGTFGEARQIDTPQIDTPEVISNGD